ncbi:MAG TPA: hypothetical protein VKA68_03170 [bacterium]|nr:hypothetical protein [bacterium]
MKYFATVPVLCTIMLLLTNIFLNCSDHESTIGDQPTGDLLLEARTFPVKESTDSLEPEILDLRYKPGRWQTCIGLPDDPHKSMVGSDGGLYYDYSSNGLYYDFNTRFLARLARGENTSESRQSLWNARVPVVLTTINKYGIQLHQETWAGIPESRSVRVWQNRRVDYLWLTMKNTSREPQTGQIVVTVGSRDSLKATADHTRITRTTQPVVPLCSFQPPPISVTKKRYEYTCRFEPVNLAPGEEFQVLVTVYRGKNTHNIDRIPLGKIANERNKAVAYWESLELPYDHITLPDSGLQRLVDSGIRNLYQSREFKQGVPVFQVGPTRYRDVWAVDNAFMVEALTYLGQISAIRTSLPVQLQDNVGPQGSAFSKRQGLHLWMIRRHAILTGDWWWLETMWDKVVEEVHRIMAYRDSTLAHPDQPNYGLMPAGYTDGGIWWEHFEYSNVYWTLIGLKSAAEMARVMGAPQLQAWEQEYHDYRAVFEKARQRDAKRDALGEWYVPITMTGETQYAPWRGQWTFLHSIFPGRLYSDKDSLMRGTLSMLDNHMREGLIYGTGWMEEGIWTVAGSFYAHAHLWLGHGRKAASTLYAFANHAAPTFVWWEEQGLAADSSQRYVGDMPHNWASAEIIRLVRHLLILEREDELHLLEGLPPTWTTSGSRTRLSDVPTSYGTMDLDLHISSDGRTAALTIDPPHSAFARKQHLKKMVVHLENFSREIHSIRAKDQVINGETFSIPASERFTLSIRLK